MKSMGERSVSKSLRPVYSAFEPLTIIYIYEADCNYRYRLKYFRADKNQFKESKHFFNKSALTHVLYELTV